MIHDRIETNSRRGQQIRARVQRIRDRWRAEGRCVICTQIRDSEDEDYATCWRCRERQAGRDMARRETDTHKE